MADKDLYMDFEDAPIEDFDPMKAGDEVAYEDEQQEMFEHYRFDIAAGQVPMRVDKYLATHMEFTSRHRVQMAIKAEYIRVNDKIVKANYVVRPGDVVTFVMPYQRRGLEILPEDIPLNIVYEDENILLVDKRPGLAVHPHDGAEYGRTLIDHIQAYLYQKREWRPREENSFTPALCNRIDRNTGGIVIAAKNAERNGVKVDFIKADALGDMSHLGMFDIIVSNPPYIPQSDMATMERNVVEYEPHTALFVADDDTLCFYRSIAENGVKMLRPGGGLYFEIYEQFGAQIAAMLEDLGYRNIVVVKDIFGKERMVWSRR